MNKRLWIYLLSNAFSIFIRLAHSTNRWEHFNYELPKKYWLNNKPFIWIHWHGQSLMLPRSWDHSSQKLFALVSKHGDGELIANTLSRLQVKLIRGAGNFLIIRECFLQIKAITTKNKLTGCPKKIRYRTSGKSAKFPFLIVLSSRIPSRPSLSQ